ncbi:MAG TPA: MBL fold metallo-hydrolase [Thermoplasmata archaeon]|nr:MBL fold metallo-hydrolase [Thermoplasmata archaeon]
MPEILPGVHLVEGVDPSPDFSTHVYLLKDPGASWTLIDTGLPGSDRAIAAYLAKVKVPPTAIKKILVTHLHRDHVGSLKAMLTQTRARSFAHWIEAAFIAEEPKYDGPGMAPAEPVTIDETLKDGDLVDAAGGLIAYHTPGHTPGHLAYYHPERKLLFSGDLFFCDAEHADLTPPDFTLHTGTARVSAHRMAQLSVDSLMSYHGGPILKNGGRAIRALDQKLRSAP